MTQDIGNDPAHLRVHEAGHAVIGRVLILKCGPVTVKPDFDEGSAGTAIIVADPDETAMWWLDNDLRPNWNSKTAPRHAAAIATMAGNAAEQVIFGYEEVEFEGSQDEYQCIDLLAGLYGPNEMQRYVDRLFRFAVQLAQRHRDKIEAVAGALAERDTLAGDEIDAIMASADTPSR
jgi:ATP-dependent Zn protease